MEGMRVIFRNQSKPKTKSKREVEKMGKIRKKFPKIIVFSLLILLAAIGQKAYANEVPYSLTITGNDFSLAPKHERVGSKIHPLSDLSDALLNDLGSNNLPEVQNPGSDDPYISFYQVSDGDHTFTFGFNSPAMVGLVDIWTHGYYGGCTKSAKLYGSVGGSWVRIDDGNYDEMVGDLRVPKENMAYYDQYKLEVHTQGCESQYVTATDTLRIYGLTASDVADRVSVTSMPVDLNDFYSVTKLVATDYDGKTNNNSRILAHYQLHFLDYGDDVYCPSFLLGDGSNWYYYDNGWVQAGGLEQAISKIGKGMTMDDLKNIPASALTDFKNSISRYMSVAVFIGPDINVYWENSFTRLEVQGTEYVLSEDDVPVDTQIMGSYLPVEVKFTLSPLNYFSQSMISSYTLDYGDGQTSGNLAGQNLPLEITHVYDEQGVYHAAANVVLADGQSVSKTFEVVISVGRADAIFIIDSSTESTFSPCSYSFTASVVSNDDRNKDLEGIPISWTIKKNGEVIGVLENQPAALEYEFQDGGNYTVEVHAVSAINTPIDGTLNLTVADRAEASLVISSEITGSQTSYAPVEYYFGAAVQSDDERNKNLSDTDVTWVIKKDDEVIDTFENQPLYLEYEFQDGGNYVVQAQATSPIDTLMSGELNVTVPGRAEASLGLTIKCKNYDRSTGKAYFPTTCTVTPGIESEDWRNERSGDVQSFIVKVFDSDDNLVQEITPPSFSRVEIPFEDQPGQYRINAAAITGIGTQAEGNLNLQLERVPVDVEFRIKASDDYAPTDVSVSVTLDSIDSRNETSLTEETFLVYQVEGDNQELLGTITPEISKKMSYSFNEGGNYKIVYNATSQIGTPISAEAILTIAERAEATYEIKARC
ncbi:MAG: hypothetical protein DRN47_06305, partial [Candidatus Wolframiiraptor sp.]